MTNNKEFIFFRKEDCAIEYRSDSGDDVAEWINPYLTLYKDRETGMVTGFDISWLNKLIAKASITQTELDNIPVEEMNDFIKEIQKMINKENK